MKSLFAILIIIVITFQSNTKMNAQKVEESNIRYTVSTLGNSSLVEIIDKLIDATPEYCKDSTLLYVVNGIRTNRIAILNIQAAKVKSVSLVKKDMIQGLYGIDAISGVVEIMTSIDYKTRRVVTGYKIPDAKMKLLFGTNNKYKGNTIFTDVHSNNTILNDSIEHKKSNKQE